MKTTKIYYCLAQLKCTVNNLRNKINHKLEKVPTRKERSEVEQDLKELYLKEFQSRPYTKKANQGFW